MFLFIQFVCTNLCLSNILKYCCRPPCSWLPAGSEGMRCLLERENGCGAVLQSSLWLWYGPIRPKNSDTGVIIIITEDKLVYHLSISTKQSLENWEPHLSVVVLLQFAHEDWSVPATNIYSTVLVFFQTAISLIYFVLVIVVFNTSHPTHIKKNPP